MSSLDEASWRIERARGLMRAAQLDGLLILTGRNLCYLSGYPSIELTLARPFYLLLPGIGQPTLIVHVGREAEARRYSWIDDVRTYRDLSIAPVDAIRETVRGMGLTRVGAELGYEQRLGIPVLELDRIRDALAPTELVDAAAMLWTLRMIKSPAEQSMLRRAGEITSEAYADTFQWLRRGLTERAIAMHMTAALMSRGGANPWVAITSGQGNYDLATGIGSERAVESGDMVWMDAGCAVSGLCSDFSRAAVIGPPSGDQLATQEAIVDITRAAVAMALPGTPVREIAWYCETRLAALDVAITSSVSGLAGRVGHGLGHDTTEPPHISVSDPTVLEPGIAIAVEPGVATAFGIFHAEQNILVADGPPELLSTAPTSLYVVG